MRDEIKATIRHLNSTSIIGLEGDVTSTSETVINEAYQQVLDRESKKILLDFRDVDYINSAGIAVLIGIVTECRRKDIILAICGLTPHFQKIFKMVGLMQYTTVYEDEAAALASFENQY